MSLINQMLRDLEQRRATEQQQSNAILRGLSGQGGDGRRGQQRMWLLGGAILGVATMAAGAYLLWPRPPLPSTPTVVATPAAPPVAVITAAPPAPAAVAMPETAAPAAAAMPEAVEESGPAEEPVAAPEAVAPMTPPPVPAPAASASVTPEVTIAKAVPSPANRSIKQPHPPSLQERLGRALALLRAGKGGEGETALRAILREAASQRDARVALAGLLFGAGRLVEAEEVLSTGVQLHPHDPQLVLLLARLRLEQGNEAAAITLLEQAAPAQPPADYLALLAALYQRAARYPASIDAYRQALSLDPAQAAWWLGLAISLEGGGEEAAAREAYGRALAGQLASPLRGYAQSRLRTLLPAAPASPLD